MDWNKKYLGFVFKIGLLEENIYKKIKRLKSREWTPKFATEVYNSVKKTQIFYN